MEVEFANKDLNRLETDAGFTSGLPSEIVRAYRRRMQQVRAAPDERDFYGLKSMRYEKLKGRRSHQRSIRLNDQWRLIIEVKTTENRKVVVIRSIEDYHK